MTEKEYIKNRLAVKPFYVTVLFYLGIIQWQVKKDSIGPMYHNQRTNPYNPLSYLVMLVLLIVHVGIAIIVTIPELIDEFKYH